MNFTLSTDRSCDIFCGELTDRGIEYISQIFTIDNVPYVDDYTKDADYKAFYDLIRAGKMPTTSQINVAEHEEFFEAMLKKYDRDLLHITLSSGLSATYESALAAAAAVNERHGKTRVYVLDSLGATVAQRQVVDEAQRLRDSGMSAEEALETMNEFKKRVLVWFMPTDLFHLRRGGRVSGASAVLGTMLNIKPVLIINKTGGLTVVAKKMGAAKSLAHMVEMFDQYNGESTGRVYVPSADSEYAQEMKEKLLAIRPDCDVQIGWVGPVIGAHTGSNMVGACFVSDNERAL